MLRGYSADEFCVNAISGLSQTHLRAVYLSARALGSYWICVRKTPKELP